MQQGVQTDATSNIQQRWKLLANSVASVCTGLWEGFNRNNSDTNDNNNNNNNNNNDKNDTLRL